MFTLSGQHGGRAVWATWAGPDELRGSVALLLDAVDLAHVRAQVPSSTGSIEASLVSEAAAIATLVACCEAGSAVVVELDPITA